jgi:hypothetical protein
MVHQGSEDKPSYVAITYTITNKFAYHPFGMSSSINSWDVTPSFHTPSGVTMGGGDDPHKQATSIFQQMVKYIQHMSIV